VGVAGLFSVCLNGFDFAYFLPSILSGGLILGAIFMATDYVTTPNTFLGNVIYFAILGLVTTGLRVATGMEVVSFAILLMNLFVPLIDKFVYPKPFGYTKAKKS
jgi:electron transport complex protein RnfD